MTTAGAPPLSTRFSIPVYFLFGQSMLMNLGFFMLIPMLSIHYLSLGATALFVGNLYAVRILAQQGLQLFGGYVSDRVPYRLVLFIGCLIRAIGFALFGVMRPSEWLFLAATLFGIGGALFGPAQNAALVALIPADKQARAFTIRQAASNVGTTVGPVLGAFLVFHHFSLICWISGLLFMVLGIASLFILPKRQARPVEKPTFWRGVHSIRKNYLFLAFVVLFMGYYVIYQQMYIAIPDLLSTLHAPKSALGELFSLEAILEIAASYPMVAFMTRRGHLWSAPRLMAIGMLVMSIGWIPLLFHVNLATLLAPVVTISIGSVIALPNRQTYTAALANPSYIATYFGVASLSMAIGASAGASGGSWLMHVLGHPAGPLAVPAAAVFVGVAGLCGLLFLRLPATRRSAPETVDSAL
ncbi:MAG: MFS transporter [Alicyclobacillaceae bacterium]|uniref:MFS transporter n=1 Tax=Alicyclobacillus sp. SP_1 TaxID=2942475 RepID=UPI0021574F5B|nr:MFS transporter [Alicyclobacillus sp. SP_1]MCY0887070.1 MFS transporter [Alicyclobacillaceae bacterium]MCY0896181.1 MFS transporter [Alicyclobacillaceae bacterium]